MRFARAVIVCGAVIVISSAVVWIINFYGMYGDVNQSGFSASPEQTTAIDKKFNQQALYRTAAEVASVIGYATIAGGIFFRSKIKNIQ